VVKEGGGHSMGDLYDRSGITERGLRRGCPDRAARLDGTSGVSHKGKKVVGPKFTELGLRPLSAL